MIFDFYGYIFFVLRVVTCVITSKDNVGIKEVVKLVTSAKRRRESESFVLEGARLCSEALREEIFISKLFYTEDIFKNHKELVEKLKAKSNFSSEVSKEVFAKMSDTSSPQGVLAVVKKSVLSTNFFKGKFIALEKVSDPSNLGAVARTAEALGFEGIITSYYGVDPYSPKALRASMGALLRLPVIYTENINTYLLNLKDNGFRLIGTVVDSGAKKINSFKFTEKEVAIIGNEAFGLSDEIKKICDELITVPMAGRAESLNAAAAAAIVMWEMVR